MRADQKKFGKSTWAAAVERIERLQYAVSKETLQLMRAKEICLEQKKHAVKEEVKYSQIKFDTNAANALGGWGGGYQRDTKKKGLCVREMTSCSSQVAVGGKTSWNTGNDSLGRRAGRNSVEASERLARSGAPRSSQQLVCVTFTQI